MNRNNKVKCFAILMLAVSGNAFSYCDWSDDDCREQSLRMEEQRRQMERRYQDEENERQWQRDREERERLNREARRSNLENRCSGKSQTGAGDQSYACDALDRY